MGVDGGRVAVLRTTLEYPDATALEFVLVQHMMFNVKYMRGGLPPG